MGDGEALTPLATKTTTDATARAITSGVIQVGLGLFPTPTTGLGISRLLKRFVQVN
jgi:hypothetical protein